MAQQAVIIRMMVNLDGGEESSTEDFIVTRDEEGGVELLQMGGVITLWLSKQEVEAMLDLATKAKVEM